MSDLPVLQVVIRDRALTSGPPGQVAEVLRDGEPVGQLPLRRACHLVTPNTIGRVTIDLDATAEIESVRI